MEKLCVFCKHFSFENDYGGEYAEGASAACALNHFGSGKRPGYKLGVYDEDDLRKIFVRATICPDYSPPSQEK